jgi:hypothetical protein
MAGFSNQLDAVNAIAHSSPGFVWAPENDEPGDAVAVFGHPLVLANISMWASLEALRQFTYRGQHGTALRQRREWFEPQAGPTYVLWWAAPEPRPTWIEARRRLQLLAEAGPTPEAFTFGRAFGPHGAGLVSTPPSDPPTDT